MGKATTIKGHKTGKKYPAYIWFSLYDVCYMRAYEAVRNLYLDRVLGKNPEDRSVAFFINTQGDPYLQKGTRLEWTRFMQIN